LIPTVFFFAKLEVNPKNPLLRIGDYSYGIYLIHAVILYITFGWLARNGFELNAVAVILAIVVAFIASMEFGALDIKLVKKTKEKFLQPGSVRKCILSCFLFFCLESESK